MANLSQIVVLMVKMSPKAPLSNFKTLSFYIKCLRNKFQKILKLMKY